MTKLKIAELKKTAEAYESLLVPSLLSVWAERLTDAAEIKKGQRVLDIACGTGIVTRTVAKRIGSAGSVFGLDINPGMLAVAKEINPLIEWIEGNAEELPFENESFDAVISQFGLMLFSDPKTALQEMMRVLRPKGKLTLAVFDSIENIPAYAAIAEIYDKIDKSIGMAIRMPFSMGNVETLASLFASVNISSPVITKHEETASFPGISDMILSDVNGWFPFAGIHLAPNDIDMVTKNAEKVMENFTDSNGTLKFQVSVYIINAMKR